MRMKPVAQSITMQMARVALFAIFNLVSAFFCLLFITHSCLIGRFLRPAAGICGRSYHCPFGDKPVAAQLPSPGDPSLGDELPNANCRDAILFRELFDRDHAIILSQDKDYRKQQGNPPERPGLRALGS